MRFYPNTVYFQRCILYVNKIDTVMCFSETIRQFWLVCLKFQNKTKVFGGF